MMKKVFGSINFRESFLQPEVFEVVKALKRIKYTNKRGSFQGNENGKTFISVFSLFKYTFKTINKKYVWICDFCFSFLFLRRREIDLFLIQKSLFYSTSNRILKIWFPKYCTFPVTHPPQKMRMPFLDAGLKSRIAMALPGKPSEVCYCHKDENPPWTGEIHGLSQALLSRSKGQKVFWWLVLIVCIIGGIITTALVVIEYVQGPTATSTTIKMVRLQCFGIYKTWIFKVPSLEFPTITLCPKVPDAFNFTAIFEDINSLIPGMTESRAKDLIAYFVAGSGLENMDFVPYNNESYNRYLDSLYQTWSNGYSPGEFFNRVHVSHI